MATLIGSTMGHVKKFMMVAALCASLCAPTAIAATYDGSRPFICVPLNIVSCGLDAQCNKETASSLDLPQFLKFDIAANEISGARPNGDLLKAGIDKVQRVEDRIVLQGLEGEIMWSVSVGTDTGEMTLTAGGDNIGFVAFGACTPG